MPKIMNNSLAQHCAKLKQVFYCFIVFLLWSISSLYAVNRQDFYLAFEPLLGVRYGAAGEYVYTEDTHGEQSKLSQLDWDMKPLLYGQLGLLFSYKMFNLDARYRIYFESKCGSMEDSDWMNITIPNAVNNKTNYSESDNELNDGMQFNCTASVQLRITPEMFSLCPFVSFEWELLDFRAKYGSGIYADAATLASNGGKPKEYKRGELCNISYERSTILGWMGTELTVCPTHRFALTFSFAIAPYMYIESLDIHDAPEGQNKRQYIDRTSGWFSAWRFSTGAMFQVSDRTSIMLDIKSTFSYKLEGNTYAKAGSGGFHKDTSSSARADISCVDISFGARYRFIP